MGDLRIENIQKASLGKDSSVKRKASSGFGNVIKKANTIVLTQRALASLFF